MMKWLRLPAVSVAAGVFLWASFAPLHLWPMSIVGIACLVAEIRRRGFGGSLACGFITGAVFFGLLCDWAAGAAGTWIARVGLGGVLALYTAVLALVWKAVILAWGESWKSVPILAVTWVAIEDFQGKWPEGGMPWGKLAFGQVEGPIVHLAPYGSTELVSFAVVVLGAGLAYAVRSAKLTPRSSVIGVACACLTLVAVAAIPLGGRSGESLKVGFVQGNVSRDKKLTGYARALTVTERLAIQTRKIEKKHAELVLWPESSSDLDPQEVDETRELIEGAVSRLDVPLLLGIQRYPEDYRYNEYTMWLPGKGQVSRYTKQHPVPFGEYIPARGFFRFFTKAVDQVSTDMRPGNGPAILDVPVRGRTVRVAAPICFEIAYTEIVSESVRKGARIIAVPTNNASFGDSAESRQQFDMTRFRAIETGRTAIQISTMGVSGIADADGTVRETTDMWTADSRVADVDLHSHLTPAVRWEIWINRVSALTAVALGVLALCKTLRKAPHSPRRLEVRKCNNAASRSGEAVRNETARKHSKTTCSEAVAATAKQPVAKKARSNDERRRDHTDL